MTATKENFFKPAKLSADAKAAQMNATVRTILDAEAAARDEKTRNLRALRLSQPVAETPLPPRRASGRRVKGH
jgi:hypothetical protein